MLSSNFHDGKMMSIAVMDDTLFMEVYADGKTTKIKVSGLEKLRVTDFEEGNIINSLRVLSPNDHAGASSEVMRLMKYAYALEDADFKLSPKYSSFLDKKLEAFRNGSVLVVELEPSYGAYAVAIGKEISEESL
ncbi:hypothetical protein [Pseudomonas triticifolii]|uniref:Uncharacterized protein n=1 Tax=Pseudomonas triticifolii TaxID=2762592 RepID=A0ABR7BF17_9PSED|nr:hypothetical protein [Pseudomonas triticifolii]MBC3955781.1 hypothetical protein [Pseudomonas triticifolii]